MDASAAPGGDGSRARPFRALPDAPVRGRVRLATGVYAGGLVLEDVELIGTGAVVLTSRPPSPCLRTRGTVRLEGLQIQGGTAGVVVESGRTMLDSVRLSGQRGAALEVGSGGELVAAHSSLQASVSGFPGVRVLEGGRAELRDVRLEGPFQRGVEATRPASLLLSGVQIRDAVTGVWLVGGTALAESLEVRGGRGPGLYVGGGALQIRGVRVSGQEYGLLTGGEARVDGRGLTSVGSARAGVALVNTKAVLEDVRVEAAGDLAAVQLLGSEVRLKGLQIQGGRASGLVARNAQLTLEDATVAGLQASDSAEGDAVQVRAGKASLAGLHVQDCSGIGVLAAEGAIVTLARSTIGGAGVAGVSVETEARISTSGVVVEGTRGPAVVVTERGTAVLKGMTGRSNRDGAVWAECSQGVTVEIDGWSGDPLPVPSACVRNVSPVSPRR